MKPDDIDFFSKHLTNHFTFATEGDAEILWGLLSKHTLPVACEAIERHRVDCGLKADRPNPSAVAAIAARIAAQGAAANAGIVMASRINGLTDDDRRAERERGQRVLSERERAQQIVAALDEQERERLRRRVLDRMPDELRPMYERRDATTPVLALGIAEILNSSIDTL